MQEVPFQEDILKCVVEMKPSVAWLFKMINSRCRHWCNDGYSGWWACYFNYKSSGLRGSIWEEGFGNSGGFCKSISLHSGGSCAHSKQGISPPSSVHIHTRPQTCIAHHLKISEKKTFDLHNLKNWPNFQKFH